MSTAPIRIATRTSDLAMWQARTVAQSLKNADSGLRDDDIALVPIQSDGDIAKDRDFQQFGYKGIFTKAIEAALLDGRATMAVHSMKDVPTFLPDGLIIAGMLAREDPRDAFVSVRHPSFESLPLGATIGTASVRRAAVIKHLRPDLNIVAFRGNVPTRLQKLNEGIVDATLLAVAGLNRLGLQEHITQILPPQTMLCAVAQGAIGIECIADDAQTRARIAGISHAATLQAVTCERAMLEVIDGDCHTPICGYAHIHNGVIQLQAHWYSCEGTQCFAADAKGRDAIAVGKEVGQALLAQRL